MESSREVFAVPGNVTQPVAFGPNQLIKQGAKLVASWEDVIEELPTPIRAELLPVETTDGAARASLVEQSLGPARRRSTLFSKSTAPDTSTTWSSIRG